MCRVPWSMLRVMPLGSMQLQPSSVRRSLLHGGEISERAVRAEGKRQGGPWKRGLAVKNTFESQGGKMRAGRGALRRRRRSAGGRRGRASVGERHHACGGRGCTRGKAGATRGKAVVRVLTGGHGLPVECCRAGGPDLVCLRGRRGYIAVATDARGRGRRCRSAAQGQHDEGRRHAPAIAGKDAPGIVSLSRQGPGDPRRGHTRRRAAG